jgi:hypothetical protein
VATLPATGRAKALVASPGTWLRDEEAAGSNPATPTIKLHVVARFRWVLCADGPVRSLAALSLAPEHRRGHGALYEAVNHGRIDISRLRRCLAGSG